MFKILVIGDSCLDIFVYGQCKRICPEAPVPVLLPSKKVKNSGMAGNVFANFKALGGQIVDLCTNSDTIIKTRFVEEKSNQMILRVDEDDYSTDKFDINEYSISDYDAVVVADYDKGFLTSENLVDIGKQAKWSFIDTKKYKNFSYFKYYNFVKMNEVEWEKCEAFGANFTEVVDKLIITRSQKGCTYNNKNYSVDTSIEVRDVSGAGDTWSASFVWTYLHTKDIEQSIIVANQNATKVIQKRGVTTI